MRYAILAVAEGLKNVQERCLNPHTNAPLQIRLSVHSGSVLAVPVNGINDYFGQTVNIAARVSSHDQKKDLQTQIQVLEPYVNQKNLQDFSIISDLGRSF